jgi:long-chain acyl-CoA synthetase
MVVGDMLTRAARKFPDKIAVIHGDVSLTFQMFNERVNRLSQILLRKGVMKGDRIGILAHNCHQFLEIYFAAAKTGSIFCPYNYLLTDQELEYLLLYSAPKVLFYGSHLEEMVEAVKPALNSIEHYVCLQDTSWPSAENYETMLSLGDSIEPEVKIEPDDVMSIFFTSGTTGKPKGAMRTHRHIVTTSITGVIENNTTYKERIMIVTPMYHVAFEDHIGRCFFVPNTTIIYNGQFDPVNVLETLARERITNCLLVPTMINALIHAPNIDRVDLTSLARIQYVGSPMPVELLKKAINAFGRFGCGFCQQYGQTETGPLTTILPPEDHVLEGPERSVTKLASAGRPVLDYEIRIVDEAGEDVATGEVGEIVVRSEAMMSGYWQLPEQTAQKIKKGWLYTGDLGRFDQDGYVYIVDRKDDLIISGGKNIYPREVEEVLYQHPAVLEAVVVGVPHEYWGEAVKAVVALHPGIELSEQEIINFCGERLAAYKKPKSVEIWKDLPKGSSGKILRRKVREEYWKGLGRRI